MSIATEITRLQNDSTAIAAAIEAQGVTVPSGSGFDDYATLIASIEGGGSSTDSDDWLSDGDTHLWIELLNSYQLEQTIRIRMIGTIDWGDGTTESVSVTTHTTFSHTYTSIGRYRIDLIPTSGTFYLGGASSSYNVMGTRSTATLYRSGVLYQAEIGTKLITTLSQYAFYYLPGLRRVYVPSSIVTLGTYAFSTCYGLRNVVFQDYSTITTTSLTSNFNGCFSLTDISGFTPPAATNMATTFYNCYSLPEITIPSTVTSLATNTLRNLYSLKYLHCLPTTPPTAAAASTFMNLPSGCVIEVPSDSLSDYQAASYWSTYADQMVGV